MIIELEAGFDFVDFSVDTNARDCVEEICASVARGEHVLYASRTTLGNIEKNPIFGAKTRGVAAVAKSSYSMRVGLLRRVQYRVSVSPTLALPERLGENHWRIPTSYVAEVGVRPTVVLCENAFDADAFLYAAKHYRIEADFERVNIRIQPRDGNGSGTPDVLQRVLNERTEFCLCVTDSDRFSPDGPRGATAIECERKVAASHWVASHVGLVGRELENSLPLNLTKMAIERNDAHAWEKFQLALNVLGNDVLVCADFKNGTTSLWVERLPIGSEDRKFWDNKRELLASISVDEDKLSAAQTQEETIVPSLGPNVAKLVYSELATCSDHESYRRAKSSINFSNWLSVGFHVFQAGIAADRIRV